jgi:DeoR family transcriptional regulator, aga operon transcriptional repressor
MLNLERRAKILELLREQGKVEVSELSRRLRASEVTIRKDLKELGERGLLRRAHGGAVRAETVSADPALNIKAALHAEEKRRIGSAAAALVGDGESVILDSGTTTQQVARHLKNRRGLRVITNALNVATELLGAEGVEVILLGGLLRQNSASLVGQFAEEMLGRFSVDKLFLAVDAVDAGFGLSTPNLDEARVNQAMVGAARETILVADSSKFGLRSLSRIVPLAEVGRVVTDAGLPEAARAELRDLGIELILA